MNEQRSADNYQRYSDGLESAHIVVFAPAPQLTVTVEAEGQHESVHLHAGGQGVWQARMLTEMGCTVTLCSAFGGETGRVALSLLGDDGFDVVSIARESSNPAYVHDRRHGERIVIAETPDEPLSRHELDELYAATIREGDGASLVLLSGPHGDAVPADTYRRLTTDLRSLGVTVMADLAGDRLDSVLAGGIDVVKVSHEELREDGRVDNADDEASLVAVMHDLHDAGATHVIVTRAERGVLLLHKGETLRYTAPAMSVVDPRGAGDSLAAASAALIAAGHTVRDAVRVGAAAGALNVTRHGLGTGDRGAIMTLVEHVTIEAIESGSP